MTDNKGKSSAEILGGVVLDEVTLKLINEWTSALVEGNRIGKAQLALAEKQDEYFTGKDGFVKDIETAVDKAVAHRLTKQSNKLYILVISISTFIGMVSAFLSDLRITAMKEFMLEQLKELIK